MADSSIKRPDLAKWLDDCERNAELKGMVLADRVICFMEKAREMLNKWLLKNKR